MSDPAPQMVPAGTMPGKCSGAAGTRSGIRFYRITKALVLLFCSWISPLNGTGQTQLKIDSMTTLLQQAGSDTARIKLLRRLSNVHDEAGDHTRRDEALEQALDLAEKNGSPLKIAEVLNQMASFQLNYGDRMKGDSLLHRALVLAEESMDDLLIERIHFNLGLNAASYGDNNKAKFHFLECRRHAEKTDDLAEITDAIFHLSITEDDLGNIPAAMEYALEMLELGETGNTPTVIAGAYKQLALLYLRMSDLDRVEEYSSKAVEISLSIPDHNRAISALNFLGAAYLKQKHFPEAETTFMRALELLDSVPSNHLLKTDRVNLLMNLGNVHYFQQEYSRSLPYFHRGLEVARTPPVNIGDVSGCLANIGFANYHLKRYDIAERHMLEAADHARKGGLEFHLLEITQMLHLTAKMKGRYKQAYTYHLEHIAIRDSIYSAENKEKFTTMTLTYAHEKKQDSLKYAFHTRQLADSLTNAEAQKLAGLNLQRQRGYTYTGIGGVIILLFIAMLIYRNNKQLTIEKAHTEHERQRSEHLLLNILPSEVAEELKANGSAPARHFDDVTVVFTDFVNFTQAAGHMSAQQLVDELHECFKAFDEIISRYGIEKIKTIGDAYMAAGGLPDPQSGDPVMVVQAALEMRDWMLHHKQTVQQSFDIRIGIHTGPVVAGVVGIKKFAYDIWGDAVNTASRMESASHAGKVNISESTYDKVKDHFQGEFRGEVEAKGKGPVKMYFVEHALTFESGNVPAGVITGSVEAGVM